jgi:ketosteroid isomerase-like protein
MMDKRVKPALLVFLLISFPLAISWAQKQSSADADSVAIKQVVASWSDAFNRHDPRAVAMLFSEDGDFTNPQGLHRHGRKEIEDRFASTLSGPFKGAHRTDSVGVMS